MKLTRIDHGKASTPTRAAAPERPARGATRATMNLHRATEGLQNRIRQKALASLEPEKEWRRRFEQMRQHLDLVISFYCRFVTLTPRHRTGDLQNVCSQAESAVAYHLRACRGDGHACKRVS